MNLICRLDQIKVLFFVNFFEKGIFLKEVLSNVRESFLIHEREDVLSGELVMKFGLRQSINPISHIYARNNN